MSSAHSLSEETIDLLQARIAELEAAVLAEREACAKIADKNRYDMATDGWKTGYNGASSDIADLIRARPAP